ncbi:phosphate ABC transporter substrate-binding protein, PhoT family [Desulfotomaculum arcticum]|uniref:Phosphate ABC transporter substrate-binding protein, PhoT family n=1 Tax=Desulfotruncus arcticus DSM 17038 TaxID=1121424 RepID=A0A1I2NRL9_9FIRM|nr:phosphate ABC transporter substrate-binding protein [Desulfotruncus arcticus]SFG06492.1 phosphate ABC transporter substrate-binding protein, PhoT family [Desulfotomaculum arcticum] [Desulfotruncus arcticus DSM 17038]
MGRNKFLALFLVIMTLFLLAGCGQNEPQATGQAGDTVSQRQSIKVGGSSTLAPVIAQCANDFTEEYKTWNKVDAELPEEPIVIFVSTGGSGFGVNSTLDGTVDIGMASREIKDEEKEKMPEGKIFKLGSDALTISVHPQNRVMQIKPDLTTDEVRRIFAGEIKTWKELDAQLPDNPIVLAIRDLGGGASQIFDELVMKGTPVSKEAIQLPSMGALAGKVMENQNAMGYVSFGLVKQNEGQLGVLKVDGVTPTLATISSGEYKIARPLLLITKDTPNAQEQLFINYLLSEKGLKVVEEMGFIPAAD